MATTTSLPARQNDRSRPMYHFVLKPHLKPDAKYWIRYAQLLDTSYLQRHGTTRKRQASVKHSFSAIAVSTDQIISMLTDSCAAVRHAPVLDNLVRPRGSRTVQHGRPKDAREAQGERPRRYSRRVRKVFATKEVGNHHSRRHCWFH